MKIDMGSSNGAKGDPEVPLRIHVLSVPGSEDLPLPAYATASAAGADLHAAVAESVTVRMGEIALVPTGIRLEIPEGYEGQVRPRSGLALRAGLTLVNAPGTIDSDYRGEVKVIVTCLSSTPCVIERGDRIAQLVIAPVRQAMFVPAEKLSETRRGEGGFGHTGNATLAAL